LTTRTERERIPWPGIEAMSASPDSQSMPDLDRLDVAADQAIAACGGNARHAVKALIVANEFLEAEVRQLQAAVSKWFGGAIFVGLFKIFFLYLFNKFIFNRVTGHATLTTCR
jgi:hypothetical protein